LAEGEIVKKRLLFVSPSANFTLHISLGGKALTLGDGLELELAEGAFKTQPFFIQKKIENAL
jgi:hypothetical protein